MGVLPEHVGGQSRNLPAPAALEGHVVDEEPTPGKYGWAVIEGVQFGVTGIELRLGAVIFHCSLMRPARFPFTVQPGSPVKIYGVDDRLIADYQVPGVPELPPCEIRPGDTATIFLPVRIGDIGPATGTDRRMFNNEFIPYP